MPTAAVLAEVGVLMTDVLRYRAFGQHPAGGNDLVVRHVSPRTDVSSAAHPVALRPRGLAGRGGDQLIDGS